MSLKERICVKLNVRNGSETLDRALIEHLDHTNVRSAAAYLVPQHRTYVAPPPGAAPGHVYLPRDEMLILYSVDGVMEPTGDVQVFVLDRTTMERHRQHASARKPIHYVAMQGAATIASADISKVSSEMPFPGEHMNVTANVDWSSLGPARFITFDANPSASVMPSSSNATQVITRSSHALTEAIAAAEASERGVANIDYETAMTQCCAWLSETIDLVESQFTASEAAADSTLGIVEAFLQRNTALQKVREYIATDPSVFTRIERALHSNTTARQRWVQKKAALDCLAESTRLCATWIALLSGHAMSLRIRNPATSQSMDGTNITMAALSDALLIIMASFPGQNVTESDQFVHYVYQRIVPQITADLVTHAEKLLNLGAIFNIGSASVPATPLCTSEGLQAHFINVSWSLRAWQFAWAQACATLNNVYPTRLGETAVTAAQAAQYSSDRCEDLRDMLYKVNRASLGIMNTEVAVLYTTMHRAANAFPLLRAAEAANWETFTAAFNKTLALKLTTVEEPFYEAPKPEAPSPVTPFSPLMSQVSVNQSLTQTTLLNHSRSLVNASMMSNFNTSAVVEEREVLSSRVTIMSQELAEARMLIASLQGQLQRSNAALATAQELNVYMMAELRKAQLGESGAALPNPAGNRETLIERLAREEHARLESGRQIEDEELDSP